MNWVAVKLRERRLGAGELQPARDGLHASVA